MKTKNFLFIIYILFHFNMISQYSISYTQIEIIQFSLKINYYNDKYINSSYGYSSQSILSTLQGRHDYYKRMVSDAWGSIRKFALINNYNNGVISKDLKEVEDWFAQNRYMLSQVDWARNGSYAENITNWISYTYDRPTIKSEVKLLNSINAEYNRLKNQYPDDFYKKPRYNELGLVLKLLESCDSDKIGELAMKYGLF